MYRCLNLSPTCHQPEYATGSRAQRFVFGIGDYKKDDSSWPFVYWGFYRDYTYALHKCNNVHYILFPKFVLFRSWMQLRDIAPSYGIAMLLALSVYFLKFLPITYWIVLPLQLILGIIVFFVLCVVTKQEEYLEMKGILTPYIKKLKNR